VSAERVYGILDLRAATPREIVNWTSMVLSRCGEGRQVSLLVARDHSHVIAVDPELGDQLEEDGRAITLASADQEEAARILGGLHRDP